MSEQVGPPGRGGARGGRRDGGPRREGAAGGERRGRGGPGGQRRRFEKPAPPPWEPKTRLGRLVKGGKITTMSEALRSGMPLREPEIVDALLPELDDEVLNINMVQRMTDSGRRVRFAITAVTGNKDGFVGLGLAKGKEVGPTIRRAIDRAKINMIEVKRGAGSWQSASGAEALSIPYKTTGKVASTEVTIRPAPQGTGLVAGKTAKAVLMLAGVQDAWVFTKGQTRTTTNYAKAVFAALSNLDSMKINAQQQGRVAIQNGPKQAVVNRGEEMETAESVASEPEAEA